MKALTTAGLTKFMQLIKSSFISTSDTVLANSISLATVATSGSYNDLTDKPTVDQTYSASSANAQSGLAVAEATRNYQMPITTISSTSGSVTLSTNNIYKVTASGNMTFTLSTPTDTTVYNQIKLMLQTTGTPTIVWGTTKYYNSQEPDISSAGNYAIYFDWDVNANGWVCGSLTVPSN